MNNSLRDWNMIEYEDKIKKLNNKVISIENLDKKIDLLNKNLKYVIEKINLIEEKVDLINKKQNKKFVDVETNTENEEIDDENICTEDFSLHSSCLDISSLNKINKKEENLSLNISECNNVIEKPLDVQNLSFSDYFGNSFFTPISFMPLGLKEFTENQNNYHRLRNTIWRKNIIKHNSDSSYVTTPNINCNYKI